MVMCYRGRLFWDTMEVGVAQNWKNPSVLGMNVSMLQPAKPQLAAKIFLRSLKPELPALSQPISGMARKYRENWEIDVPFASCDSPAAQHAATAAGVWWRISKAAGTAGPDQWRISGHSYA